MRPRASRLDSAARVARSLSPHISPNVAAEGHTHGRLPASLDGHSADGPAAAGLASTIRHSAARTRQVACPMPATAGSDSGRPGHRGQGTSAMGCPFGQAGAGGERQKSPRCRGSYDGGTKDSEACTSST